jgi:hypothetical protein
VFPVAVLIWLPFDSDRNPPSTHTPLAHCSPWPSGHTHALSRRQRRHPSHTLTRPSNAPQLCETPQCRSQSPRRYAPSRCSTCGVQCTCETHTRIPTQILAYRYTYIVIVHVVFCIRRSHMDLLCGGRHLKSALCTPFSSSSSLNLSIVGL